MVSAAAESRTYRKLQRRNGVVGVLRFAVPLAGLLVLLGLALQLVWASMGGRFEVGRITVTPDAVIVEAPQYMGVLQDGSRYRVTSSGATSTHEQSQIVNMTRAQLVLDKVDGVQMIAEANEAVLDTQKELTIVYGTTEISDSTGTTGTIENSVFDWQQQILTTNGAVSIDYADGSSVRAEGLVYDAQNTSWTFTRSVVTVPSTPGQSERTSEGKIR